MNNPFRYTPCLEIQKASEDFIKKIDEDNALHDLFKEGKMMGILWVEDPSGERSFLYAFSGNVQGRNNIEGFVPPIYDLLDPEGYFKKEEAEISKIGKTIQEIGSSYRYNKAISDCNSIINNWELSLQNAKTALERAKKERDEKRSTFASLSDSEREKEENELIRQSQFEKAEYRRLKKKAEQEILLAQQRLNELTKDVDNLKAERKRRSDALQKWIFEQFIVHNSLGEYLNIEQVFSSQGLVPPGGTGECAGPKLLEYAYRNKLRPLSMGEFWYGDASSKNIHVQGNFYPSCQAKCGPLLEFMLKGLDIEKEEELGEWYIIYEDDYLIAVDKPSGWLSVPGKTGQGSLIESVSQSLFIDLYPIHRLDMDTSGIILFAKSQKVQSLMQTMFETKAVKKEYIAFLDPREGSDKIPYKGIIRLPLCPDYENRPRQMVDKTNGKKAITQYRIEESIPGAPIKVTFFPQTGRTHQLRIHSAHPEGLGSPICGDKLYGSKVNCDLALTAVAISFRHPILEKNINLRLRRVEYMEYPIDRNESIIVDVEDDSEDLPF